MHSRPEPQLGREWIGITSTVPIEVIFAASLRPVDLNNLFITSPDPVELVEEAERAGFPRNLCAWIKGIYTVAHRKGIKRIVAVMEGDCSNTHALAETFKAEGIEVIDFGYPHSRDPRLLKQQLERLAGAFGVSLSQAEEVKKTLDKVREKARIIDTLTFEQMKVTGEENHLYLINCSDMRGDYAAYERVMSDFLAEVESRPAPSEEPIRLGYMGIPPICSGLYEFCEELGAHVVFNEMQRQFSMPYHTSSLVEQYTRYTYPYDIFYRLKDIEQEIQRRRIEGMLHYVQSFCFRQIQNRIVHQHLGVPVLTVEFDRPGPLDNRTRTRIEAFLELLREGRRKKEKI